MNKKWNTKGFLETWNEIANNVLEFFPGFEIYGFNDGEKTISFVRIERLNETTGNFVDHFTLPLRACLALISKTPPKNITNYIDEAEMACYKGDLKTFKYLLENKKIDLSDKKNMNKMLETAKIGQQVEVFEYLKTLTNFTTVGRRTS